MADGIRFDVSGLDGVNEKMKLVKAEVIHRTGRAALRRAVLVLRDQARSNARRVDDYETDTAIWKNIDIRWDSRAYKESGVLPFKLGVLGGARRRASERLNVIRGRKGASPAAAPKENPGGDTWYWRMVEFGTSKMRANPIIRPVADQAGQKAVDTFARYFNEGLDRAIRRSSRSVRPRVRSKQSQ